MNCFTELAEVIPPLELKLKIFQYVHANFKSVKVKEVNGQLYFRSKTVNKEYTHFSTHIDISAIYVDFRHEGQITHNGIDYTVVVYADPPQQRLAYLEYTYPNSSYLDRTAEIKFNKYKFHWKTNELGEKVLIDCKKSLMKFIAENSKAKLNMTNLDPRLAKLLAFT